jgi:pimeloyl-ACP methyl ester carboxylesterase
MTRILFLPGAAGSPEFWRPVAQRLPVEWEMELPPWPGAGDQLPDPAVNSFDDLIERIAAGLRNGTDLVAQSMGGVVALGVALRRPAVVRRLVLVATSGGIDVTGLGQAEWRTEYRAEFPDAAAWITGERPAVPPDRIATLEQPALLIWGDADPVSPPAIGRRLHELLPANELVIVPGAGHDLAQTHADGVAELIRSHLG